MWCYEGTVIGSYRARSGLYRFTLVWYCADYATAVFRQGGMIHLGGTVHYLRYTIFYFVFTSVHYTSSYTGKVVVLARLLPIRVDTSCGDLCLLYLCILCTAYIYLTDNLAVWGLSADLSVIYGSACLAVLIL